MFLDTRPAELDAAGDEDPWHEFRVGHPAEVLALLRRLRDGAHPVNLNGPGGQMLGTVLWSLDEARGRLNFSVEPERPELPGLIEPFLDRKLVHVDMIEHAVLRVASCELFNHPETPYKVIVNEYVNLSKKFGADQAHKFINGVLDKVAAQTRPQEFKPRHTDRNRDTV